MVYRYHPNYRSSPRAFREAHCQVYRYFDKLTILYSVSYSTKLGRNL